MSCAYHSLRTPRLGRCMFYDPFSCDLVVGASDTSVYRLNLDRGQYLAPFETDQSGKLGVNAVARAPLHGLYGFGCESGTVEFWDRRDRKRVGLLKMSDLTGSDYESSGMEVTALSFLPDGITWAAGTSTGQVSLFDLRSTRPLMTRDHHYRFPIKEIKHHASSDNLISYDKKTVRIWSRDGTQVTAVETNGGVDLNHVAFSGAGEDGFLLCSVEDRQMQSFFIPALGAAPRWASFLENLTEEMEEGLRVGDKASVAAGAVYDNYKFVTKAELSALNLDHFIGTNLLRAYMHGYFIDLRLYEKAKSISNPFAYEEYMEEQRKAKLEAERESRIKAGTSLLKKKVDKKNVTVHGSKAKVNVILAERLHQQSDLLAKLEAMEKEAAAAASAPAVDGDSEEDEESRVKELSKIEKKALKAAKSSQSILEDNRFASLFTNPEFAIDEEAEEFKRLQKKMDTDD